MPVDPVVLVLVVERRRSRCPRCRAAPVGIPLAASASAATNSSWTPGPASTRVAAVQSWPALKSPAPAMPSAAFSMSASSKTIDRRLAAELEVHPLEVGRRRLGDLHAGAHRAGDRDHRRGLVRDQRAAGVAVAADDVEHAGRQELLADLGEQRRAGGRGVARLEDDRVAAGQRRARSSRSSSAAGSSTASPGRRRRPAPGGPTTCGRPCTRPPSGPRARERHRRRTGSGRRRRASPPTSSARSGLPVSLHSTALISSTRVVDRRPRS